MKLPPQLTVEYAKAALQALSVGGGARVIDASGLRDFDSSALALLLQAKRQAQAAGQVFEVRAAPPKLVQLAQLYGVDELLGIATATAPARTG